MTIECKDLEWHKRFELHDAKGVSWFYTVGYDQAGNPFWQYGCMPRTWEDSLAQAQAAANEHNKQQFYKLIEQWRKG